MGKPKISLVFCFILYFTCPQLGYSQDTISKPILNLSAGVRFDYGSFFTSHPKAEYVRDSYSYFGEIFVEHATTGKKNWHISNRCPSIGLSFLFGNSGSKEYIGNLGAIYPYIRFKMFGESAYKASLKMGGGLAWITKPYDIYTNPKNTLLGSRFNAYLNLAFQNEVKLFNKLSLDAGIGIMHISNGSTTLPNLGLNIPYINAGIRYNFTKVEQIKRSVPDTSSRKIDIVLYTSIATKQYPWVGGNYYMINVFQGEVSKRISRNSALGLGLAIFYDRTLRRYIMEDRPDDPHYKKLQAGVYGYYEHFLGRLSLPIQLGAYVYNGSKSGLFQQYGLRYRMTKHFLTEILLKSHSGQADFIHVGIGYKF